jgi:hypothetical protein
MELNKGDVVAMHNDMTGEDVEGVVETVSGPKVQINFGYSELWLDADDLILVRRAGENPQ